MWCNLLVIAFVASLFGFQCRTQHCMWCNVNALTYGLVDQLFQCRTQHCMWCSSVAHSPCPAQGERAFWKVVDFLYRFSLIGRHFHRKTTALIGAFPCAARSCAQMENGDGRMRLCGIAVAFSTFLHLLYHIKYDMTFQHYSHSFFTSLGFGRTARLRKRLSLPSMLICAMFLSHSGCWVRPQSSMQMRSLIASL